MQFGTLALAALAGLASAQNTGTKMIVVKVGDGGMKFSPEKVVAEAGDMIQFQFIGGNHTVTQSTFAAPCTPISMSNTGVQGFHSGFQPADASSAQGMTSTFSVLVNDTKPMWAYCAQGKHCENGMVMVINEDTSTNSSLSLEEFKKNAAAATTVIPTGDANGGTNGNNNNGGGNGGNNDGNNGDVPAGAMALAAPTTLALAAVFAALFTL